MNDSRALNPYYIATCLILVCTSLSQTHVFAEPIPPTPALRCSRDFSLEEFKAVALKKSPLVAEIDAEYAQQVAHAIKAETLANPEVTVEQVYTGMKLEGADDSQTNASLALPLRLSNFGSRTRVAALLRRAGDTQKRAKLLELTNKISVQFFSLLALQKGEEILGRSEDIAARQITSIHQGIKTGLLSEGDHKLFEGERYRLKAQRSGVQSSIKTLQAELSTSIGEACIVKAKGSLINPPLADLSTLIAAARNSDIGEAARTEILLALSTEQDRLARLDTIPEFSPRIVYQHTNDGGDFLGAGISIPLPLFDRNQGARTISQASLQAARRKMELLGNGALQARITSLHDAVTSAVEQSEIYSKKVVPAFRQALHSQEQLYAQGRGSIMQVWQMLRTLNDAEREALAVWNTSTTTRIQLSLLVGEEV